MVDSLAHRGSLLRRIANLPSMIARLLHPFLRACMKAGLPSSSNRHKSYNRRQPLPEDEKSAP